jgi:hypothetical protein
MVEVTERRILSLFLSHRNSAIGNHQSMPGVGRLTGSVWLAPPPRFPVSAAAGSAMKNHASENPAKKALAFAGFWWDEIRVIQKSAAAIALFLMLVSCGKKQDASVSGSDAETAPRTMHAIRPPSGATGARDQLRTAFETAKLMGSGEERDKAISEIAWKALESAPDLAAAAILELPAGNEGKMALIDAYLRKLVAEEKSADAITWAESLGDERDIAYAREKISLLRAEAHPELLPASSFTAAGVDPVAEQALQNWSAKNPSDAAAWAARLPAGEARTAGFKIVLTQWLNNDASAALTWAGSQHNPQSRQEAMSAVIRVLNELPDPIRNILLEPADPSLRAEVEQGIAEIARQSENEEPAPEPETEPVPSE